MRLFKMCVCVDGIAVLDNVKQEKAFDLNEHGDLLSIACAGR